MTEVATSIGGPVSEVLEAEVRGWVRSHGVVVWLDRDDRFSGFVDRLIAARVAGELPYAVAAFRGSHLELMMALEDAAGGVQKPALLIHLPGFTEEAVWESPLLELYEAGMRYRKALPTLVAEAAAGRVLPDRIDELAAEAGLTLEAADEWLATELASSDDPFGAHLRRLSPTAVMDALLRKGGLADELEDDIKANALWAQLETWTGLGSGWRDAWRASGSNAERADFVLASWALAVEFVHDLRRAPVHELLQPATKLSGTLVESCRALAAHLRVAHPSFYEQTADETEARLADEVAASRAEDLGKIDTFRFEEDQVLVASVTAAARGDCDSAAEWAALRVGTRDESGSFWLRDDVPRRSAWRLVLDAACLGQALQRAGERLDANDLASALERYAKVGAAVDQAHRHLEQHRAALLHTQLPHFEVLRDLLDDLRGRWRQWADRWAVDFNAICRSQGFLPEASLQQRALFEDIVLPMSRESGTTAYFVVDAFRYEMAEELYRELRAASASTVHINARLAELPTVTEVGMNVLAPVARNGRLSPVLSSVEKGRVQGFSTGEYRVSTIDTRKKAMHDRVGGRACPWLSLEEAVSRDSASLKKSVAQASLLIVHSQEIDSAGEKGVGPSVFDHVMQKLRSAWRLLHEAGVRRFVFTADHGFLLLGEGTGAVQAHGRRTDPSRRHVFREAAADHAGEVRVALSELGYEGVSGYLMFPETTAVFDRGNRPASFVHGGNSLQERVIPVLTAVHRAAPGGSTVKHAITAEVKEGVAGMHSLGILVKAVGPQGLDFGSPETVELALRMHESAEGQVELCQTRGPATIHGGAVRAKAGEAFELFFKLTGPQEHRALVELYHPSGEMEVEPCVPEARFEVTASRVGEVTKPDDVQPPVESAVTWLSDMPETVRPIFAHLAKHGAVTEDEAARMLGGARAVRRLSVRFEQHAKLAPFGVRIETVAGVKRWVREGSGE